MEIPVRDRRGAAFAGDARRRRTSSTGSRRRSTGARSPVGIVGGTRDVSGLRGVPVEEETASSPRAPSMPARRRVAASGSIRKSCTHS